MVMNYNQQSEDFNTLDRPIASEDNTVRFEDGSTMDIHEDSSLMESEIYTHVSHAMDDKVIARIYDFVTEIAPLPSTLNDDAQYSFFDENPNALDELHRATNAMELVRKAYPDIIRQTGSI